VRFETEALALSGCLDDTTLAAIVTVVSDGLAGPLARSGLALSRAVVAWCRTAARRHPGPLIDAVAAGLAGGLRAGEAAAAPLDLPVPPPGTEPLRRRIGALRPAAGGA
jgi:hypothetical protein